MSQENVEIVRRAFAAWSEVDRGLADPQRVTEFFTPDSIWEMGTFSGWPERSTYRGVDGFLEFRAAWTEPYDEWSYDVEEILDAGANRVVATLYQRGKLRGSDSWVDLRFGIVYTIGNGLIQRSEVYASAEEALEAAGLRE